MSDRPGEPQSTSRRLRPNQRAEVWVVDVSDQSKRLVYTSETVLIEAPNWSPDGRGLLLMVTVCCGDSISMLAL